MSEYIVLRDRNFNPRVQPGPFGFDTFSGGGAVANGGSSLPPSPEISVEQMTKADVDDMRRDPAVQAITRRMPISLIAPLGEAESDDTGNTWGVEAVRADQSPFDGAGIKVAVLDTGIDPTHAAFAGINLDMKNFTGGPDNSPDGNGHGTHCAGTVFGRDVDGLRIGVARGVSDAAIGKVLGDDGSGSSEMLFAGMQWARSSGAKVISMSVGFDFPGLVRRLSDDGWPTKLAASVAIEAYRGNVRAFDALMNMFRAMAEFDGGTIVVAASGNESERQIDSRFEVSSSLPAAAFDVISVGALAQTGAGLSVADFSNTNPVLSAPGVNVLSAKVGGGIVALNGTSMACPHVAGLSALWWDALSRTPIPLTSEGVRARLRVSADTSVFTAETDIADRGEGLAIAPSGLGF